MKLMIRIPQIFFLARDMILRHLLRTAQVLKHSQMRVFLTLNVLKNDYQKLLTMLRNFQIEIDVFCSFFHFDRIR